MSKLQYAIVVGLIAIGFGLPHIWPLTFTQAIDLSNRPATDTGNLLTQIMFFALLIERATEVYILSAFGAEQRVLQSKDLAQRNALDRAKRLLKESLQTSDSNVRKTLIDEVFKAEQQLTIKQSEPETETQLIDFKQKVGTHSTVVAVGLSLLVSLVGVRVFGGLIDADASITLRTKLVSGTDVIITGLMLAGGAKSLHPVMNLITSLAKPKT